VPAWLDAGPGDVRDAVARALMDGRFDAVIDPLRTLKDLVRTLEKGRLDETVEQYKQALKKAQEEGDRAAANAISSRLMELIRNKQGLAEAPQRP
jgi:ABC-type amino acid transport substrate-binding protein